MTEVEERKGGEVTIETITATVAQLASYVQTLNDILLVVLHNMKDMEIPEWKDLTEIEKDVTELATKCVQAARKANGPSKTDKS